MFLITTTKLLLQAFLIITLSGDLEMVCTYKKKEETQINRITFTLIQSKTACILNFELKSSKIEPT